MDIIIQIISIAFWFIVILIPLVAIHEFGHLIIARIFGVKVLEYGIGIPPRAYAKRWKGITWSLNYVLLGGFARIYGDHDAIDEAYETAKTDPDKALKEYKENRYIELIAGQDVKFFLEDNNIDYDDSWEKFEKSDFAQGKESLNDSKEDIETFKQLQNQLYTLIEWEFDVKLTSKDTFFSKNWIQQTLILLGGITFNMLTAVVLLLIMFTTTGSVSQVGFEEPGSAFDRYAFVSERSEYLNVGLVYKDSAADFAGLKPGDELISIGGDNLNNVANPDEFVEIVQNNKGVSVPVVFRSSETGEIVTSEADFIENEDGRVVFGIRRFGYSLSYKANNFFDGVLLAIDQTNIYFILNFEILGEVFQALNPQADDRSALEYVSGPLAVSSFSSRVFRDYGVGGILFVIAMVSISLAVLNLLPIPALDGGRWLIITINKLTGKRNKRLEAVVITTTFFLLLVLGIFIAFRDVQGIVDGRF